MRTKYHGFQYVEFGSPKMASGYCPIHFRNSKLLFRSSAGGRLRTHSGIHSGKPVASAAKAWTLLVRGIRTSSYLEKSY